MDSDTLLFCAGHVDNKLHFGRSLHGQIHSFFSFEQASAVNACDSV
jgi:hypothetical protein